MTMPGNQRWRGRLVPEQNYSKVKIENPGKRVKGVYNHLIIGNFGVYN
jgi:hypothetical protein